MPAFVAAARADEGPVLVSPAQAPPSVEPPPDVEPVQVAPAGAPPCAEPPTDVEPVPVPPAGAPPRAELSPDVELVPEPPARAPPRVEPPPDVDPVSVPHAREPPRAELPPDKELVPVPPARAPPGAEAAANVEPVPVPPGRAPLRAEPPPHVQPVPVLPARAPPRADPPPHVKLDLFPAALARRVRPEAGSAARVEEEESYQVAASATAPVDVMRFELRGGGVVVNMQVSQLKEVKRDWKFIGKGFGMLGAIYLLTALVSITSAFTVRTPMLVTDQIGTWFLYLVGAALPWLVTAVLGFFRKKKLVKAVLPYVCFVLNSLSTMAFSSQVLGYVSVRGALLMPLMLGILASFSAYAQKMNYSVEPVRLILVALSGVTGLIKADLLLIKYLSLHSEADTVAKATYVQILVLTLCHICDVMIWNEENFWKAVSTWYVYNSMGNRKVVSTVLGLVIGTKWF